MKRKNTARNALITSILSLLLCVSMLVGATFAWFTDEVTSGNNTIAAGNLDIEMYHSNGKVTDEKIAAATDLFLDKDGSKILWEPGVVSYENIEIANVGNLALQYRLSLNISNENNLNGHSLSEVLKVVLLEQPIASGTTRAEVMALATAALEDPDYTLDGKLAQMVKQGELYPEGSTEGNDSITGALVIFWEPNDNEIDNLYNANNGQKTSDEQPLHIDFGVNLQATQLMYEDDSFGPDYDKLTGFRPMPSVDGYGPEISYTEGIGGAVYTTVLDTAYQFRPTETYEQGQKSEYFNYFVDFVVSADRYVPADSIMLAGYYKAWCGDPENPSDPDSWNLNDGNWVGLIGGNVDAGEEIRLVNAMGGGAMDIQYKHLLEYGNDGIGFLCGAKDMTGVNAGTTLTVKLNMYKAVLNDDGHYEETGDVITVGKFTYTFGVTEQDDVIVVKDAAELQAALDNAEDGAIINFGADITGNVKATQKPGVDVVINGNGHKFNGVMTVFGDGNQAGEESLCIKNINFVAAEGADSCIVSPDKTVYNKYSYSHNVTVEGCTFTDPDGEVGCAAVRHEDGGDVNWKVVDCVVDNTMHSLIQVNNVQKDGLTIQRCEIYSKNGINLNQCTKVSIIDCEIDVKGYAVRYGVKNTILNGNFEIKDSTLKSANDEGDAVIICRGDMSGSTVTITNTTLVGTPEIDGNANVVRN